MLLLVNQNLESKSYILGSSKTVDKLTKNSTSDPIKNTSTTDDPNAFTHGMSS